MNGEHFPFAQYALVVVGIVISVVLPILRKLLPHASRLESNKTWRPYLVIGLFSLVTALLVVAFGGPDTKHWVWYTSLLAGYAWDSTLQKIAGA